jgi:hypothetical protein
LQKEVIAMRRRWNKPAFKKVSVGSEYSAYAMVKV